MTKLELTLFQSSFANVSGHSPCGVFSLLDEQSASI